MSLEVLIKQRGTVRSQVTRLHTKVYRDSQTLSQVDKIQCTSKAEQLLDKLSHLDSQITEGQFARNPSYDYDAEARECEEYNDRVLATLALLKSCGSEPAGAAVNNGVQMSKLKLPEAPLPKFSNAKSQSLTRFLKAFESVTAKHVLTAYDKFNYLRGQLSGEPLTLVESLDEAKQSYECAKSLLQEAFASETLQKFDAIGRLSKLNLDSSGNVYEFVGEVRVVSDLFETLKIEIKDLLQYFTWKAMPSILQDQFVHICNSNKPTFADINKNMFVAIDRYNEISERNKITKKSAADKNVNVFATSVNYKSNNNNSNLYCSLCSVPGEAREKSHSTNNCSVYSGADAKIRRLQSLKGCTRCGYVSHATKNCNFKFSKPCYNCKGFHMSFLCTGEKSKSLPKESPTDNSEKTTKKSASVVSSVVWTESALSSYGGSGAILPTFTCSIGSAVNVRAIKDSCSQPNFIDAALAESLNLPVVRNNLQITINGFNESSNYNTKIVEVQLCVGGEICRVEAICVPRIKTVLRLPGLPRVASEFCRKGYKLADKNLNNQSSDEISDIKFVLGSSNPEVLVEKQVCFGERVPQSVFSETKAGVMLLGNPDHILSNIEYLPKCIGPDGDSMSYPTIFSTVIEPCPTVDEESNIENVSKLIPVNSTDILSDNIAELDLDKLATDELQRQCDFYLNCDSEAYREDSTEVNSELVKFALDNCVRETDGRIRMPLFWRQEVVHLLKSNLNLARNVLMSNFRKLEHKRDKLLMMDQVFREQETTDIIDRIELTDLETKYPNHSFLAHMPIFKMDKATTKCRMVFLSNLCERHGNATMSHNQVMHPGPQLNSKITVALLQLRFGQKLICYDLKKAFCQISLSELDSQRLMFLWFRDVPNEDYSLVAFRNKRLSFGLRCSPSILMLAMYRILCVDNADDEPRLKEFKSLLYNLLYMDNGAWSGKDENLPYAFEMLQTVFKPYQFDLQQIYTNSVELQDKIDAECGSPAPVDVGLLGMTWNRNTDTLRPKKIELDKAANTKRSILRSIAGQYDVYNVQGPYLNRARLFMRRLQCDKKCGWDDILSNDLQREWKNIAVQANETPTTEVPRFVGDRSDEYELIAFSDASRDIYAAVVYIKNLTNNEIFFVAGKNRLVNRQLEAKSIPTLELQAISLGVEMLMDTYEQLCTSNVNFPLNMCKIRLFSDSMISLHWLNGYTNKMDKQQNLSVFVLNRLKYIVKQCLVCPVTFGFVATSSNPADCLSRPMSLRKMRNSDYINAPEFLREGEFDSSIEVTVPPPFVRVVQTVAVHSTEQVSQEHLVPLNRFRSLRKLIRVYTNVYKFIEKLKTAVTSRHVKSCSDPICSSYSDISEKSRNYIISLEQRKHFAEIFTYFEKSASTIKDCPPLITKLNLFIDEGLIKVKSKFERWKNNHKFRFLTLLPNKSLLAEMIIEQVHQDTLHSGCYAVLTHLRKKYHLEQPFNSVKKVLRKCLQCRRVNSRTITVSQNSYRDFRADPENVIFRNVFLDHLGPFYSYVRGAKVKLWLLCITCMWSRGVNLKICHDLSVASFLRAFQCHVFEHGVPSRVLSDSGSQLVSAGRLISDIMSTREATEYLTENGIKYVGFEHYSRGNSSLGSPVEVCVKQTKRLIFGAIRNLVLEYADFECIVSQAIYLLNTRPIAYKEALRDEDVNAPCPITPQNLILGRELVVSSVIPTLQEEKLDDPDWKPGENSLDGLHATFKKMQIARERLTKVYNEQFRQTLIAQATDKKGRYRPKNHEKLKIGDLVLLKEPNLKSFNYPLAIVKEIFENNVGETTDVVAMKGKNGELVKRHVTSLIKFMSAEAADESIAGPDNKEVPAQQSRKRRGPVRKCRGNV